MHKVFRKKLTDQIDSMMAAGKLNKNKVVCFFGISDSCRETITYLREKGIEVKAILDNDVTKQGRYCCGVKALPVREGIGEDFSDKVVLISSLYWREMKTQLLSLGMAKEQILVLFVLVDKTPLKADFYKSMEMIIQGRDIYKNIVGQYKPDCQFFICPYTGTGDVYLVGTLLPAYLEKHQIENYVLIVVNASCRKVANLFEIPHIYQLARLDDVACLMKYYMLCPGEVKLKVLNDCWRDIHTCLTQWIRGLHGLDFMQMYKRFVFELEENVRPKHPVSIDNIRAAESFIKQSGMVSYRTVVLAPYATTLAKLPDEFWDKLAKVLSERGYIVFTNSSGSIEPVVKGTKSVLFPLDIAPQVISRAGYFVGVRSGLCDVISAAKAKKVVLYDRDETFFNCSAMEYFSLNKMGLCNDAIEIEYDSKDYWRVFDSVIAEFPRLYQKKV